MRRFLHSPLPTHGEVTLDAATSHHLLRVVGIAPGQAVELFDGAGAAARARLVAVEAGLATLEVEERRQPDPPVPRYLLMAVVRPAAVETALRMATELGLTDFWPVETERTVRGAGTNKLARWQRIVEGAAMQCGRAELPAVADPRPLEQALAALPPNVERLVATFGAPLASPTTSPAAVVIGPEGGLTPDELAICEAAACGSVSLSQNVLRAETAAATALALLQPVAVS